MLQKSQRTGQHILALAFSSVWLLFMAAPASAWDQADPRGAPDYNAILAEKVFSNHLVWEESSDSGLLEAALRAPGDSGFVLHTDTGSAGSAPLASRYSAGWSMPVNAGISTGPVAQFAVDDSRLSCPKCERVDSNNAGHIASFGWRVERALGWISPWAQVSYSYQLNDDRPTAARIDAGEAGRESNWMDVSVGASLPLGRNLAAYTSFAQTGADSTGEQQIYSLGVSASF